jgi:hypothetical protein
LWAIRAQDAGSADATAQLSQMCRCFPYDGDAISISVEALFAEIEQQHQADEVFGPRADRLFGFFGTVSED